MAATVAATAAAEIHKMARPVPGGREDQPETRHLPEALAVSAAMVLPPRWETVPLVQAAALVVERQAKRQAAMLEAMRRLALRALALAMQPLVGLEEQAGTMAAALAGVAKVSPAQAVQGRQAPVARERISTAHTALEAAAEAAVVRGRRLRQHPTAVLELMVDYTVVEAAAQAGAATITTERTPQERAAHRRAMAATA